MLSEIDAASVPELVVFNKSDLAPGRAKELVADHPGSVAVSAATGEGLDTLLRTLADRLRARSVVYGLSVPYDRGDVLAAVHREGEVLSVDDGETAWRIEARLSDASVGRLGEFLVDGETVTPEASDGRAL